MNTQSAATTSEWMSDRFDWPTLGTVVGVATFLCVANYVFLKRHEISRARLDSSRSLQLFQARRSAFRLPLPSEARTAAVYSVKMLAVTVPYVLIAMESSIVVCTGIALAILCLGNQVRKILGELFNPKSLYQRKYLLFERNPRFIRERLCWELCRRTLNIVLFVAVCTTGAHALDHRIGAVPSGESGTSILLLHVRSAVAGMTSLGGDPLNWSGPYANAIAASRSLLGFGVLLSFVALIINGLANEPSEPQGEAAVKRISDSLGEFDARRRDDVRAAVTLILEDELEMPADKITDDADIFEDLNADSLEIVTVTVRLENTFKVTIDDETATELRKVGQIVNWVCAKVQDRTVSVIEEVKSTSATSSSRS